MSVSDGQKLQYITEKKTVPCIPKSPAMETKQQTNLAALAGEESVVVSRNLVSTHGTHLVKILVIRVVHHFKLGCCGKSEVEKHKKAF